MGWQFRLSCVFLCCAAALSGSPTETCPPADLVAKWQTLTKSGQEWQRRSEFAKARVDLAEALALVEATPCAEEKLAVSLNNLGAVEADLNHHAEAERLYLRSLGAWKNAGSAAWAHAAPLNNLAILYRHRRAYEKAEAYYKQSLDLRVAQFGAESAEVAVVLNNLGELAYLQKHFAEAERNFGRAIVIFERQSPTSAQYPAALLNMAALQRDRGRSAAAETFAQRASFAGADTSVEVEARIMLAEYAFGRRDYRAAERLAVRSKHVAERLYGERHYVTGLVYAAYSKVLNKLGRETESDDYRSRATAILAASLQSVHVSDLSMAGDR